MAKFELFGTAACPYTQELREYLEWRGVEFVEYDVDVDSAALARMLQVANGRRTVPVLIEDGKVAQIGWQGRGCIVGGAAGGA